jgi:hypothetical protein
MSISYQPKDSSTQSVALKVQELTVKLSDSAIVSQSGAAVTINVNEAISEVRSASIFIGSTFAAGTVSAIAIVDPSTGSVTTNGKGIKVTLSTAMLAADALTCRYVVV